MKPLDYIVIALYAVGMLGIGLYYSRKVHNTDDYLLGGRTMSPMMIGLSLFATMTSTLTYLALPGEMILKGPVIFAEYFSFPIVYLIVGYILIPRIAHQPVTSGYELLEARLGLPGRLLGASLFVILRVVWMATILFATADAVLIPLFNLTAWYWMPVICLSLGAITLIYTTLGGLRAVVLTDALQALLMVFGAIAAIWIINRQLGGVEAWWPTGWLEHWADPVIWPQVGVKRTVVSAFLNMLAWMTCTAGSDQMAIQRYLATPNVAAARRSFGVQLTTNVLIGILLGVAGLAVMAYFRAMPNRLPADWVLLEHADRLMPKFIVVGLPAGLTGLVIAAILSAAMSSLSSGLNSSSAVVVTDFIGRAGGRVLDPKTEIRYARWISVIVGIIAVGLSLLVGGLAENLLELCFKVVNLLTAPIFVLFFLALFVPRASSIAAIVATICSVTTAAVLSFGWDGNWLLLSAISSFLVGATVGTLVSYIVPNSNNDTSSETLK